ncbi:dephospho-CoA kinase [Vibrio brasiliensis]|jgi:dephospho-CoA kinase|uniref:dephospho-CoA kinase n=1 Tax=Vibrio brasiliensis TaxID=170652 RepID=UPI001EFE2778|nr:dephospho-CoA kinase [Vibrio brasiliensis]MCG9650294.1 dephospho-CoA kinase [Vibrio brasiliensis]MCG9727244.1 dephospho-CoA kinase [Vibrio brasiliensis]MCG9749711.1 dephospho-CoA kinase [Vibrio brasiliensis]MCG9784500.1 dephospho-CoA kinase [Vibrio brasiliensis]
MALVIGLTGGIASGKTTVANLFEQEFGIEIVDADVVARQVVEPGSAGLEQITQHFGPEVIEADGTLNRARLREIIFADPSQKEWLNNLLHPMIREQMLQQLETVQSDYALLVIPLMVENNLQSLADKVVVVDVDPETQIQRTVERDQVDQQQAEAIVASQASREQRLAIADYVIKNNTKNQKLLYQITELHKKFLEMCRGNL